MIKIGKVTVGFDQEQSYTQCVAIETDHGKYFAHKMGLFYLKGCWVLQGIDMDWAILPGDVNLLLNNQTQKKKQSNQNKNKNNKPKQLILDGNR